MVRFRLVQDEEITDITGQNRATTLPGECEDICVRMSSQVGSGYRQNVVARFGEQPD